MKLHRENENWNDAWRHKKSNSKGFFIPFTLLRLGVLFSQSLLHVHVIERHFINLTWDNVHMSAVYSYCKSRCR